MNPSDVKERRIAWTMLIVCPLSMLILLLYVTGGNAQGQDSGHPMEYLQATCLLWAAIMCILPILRLTRVISLPLWFVMIVYADMYLYVISLCQGFYKDIVWWGDFTHVIASLVVSSIIFMALCLMQSRSPDYVSFGSKGGIVALLVLVGAGFGCLWEVMEGFTDILTGQDYMAYGAKDTLCDLGSDLLGVFAMATVAWIILSRQSIESIASMIRLGRNGMDV